MNSYSLIPWHMNSWRAPSPFGVGGEQGGRCFSASWDSMFFQNNIVPSWSLQFFRVSDLVFLCTSPLESSLETWFVLPSLSSFLLSQFWESNPSLTLCFLIILEPIVCSLWALSLKLWTIYNTTITISKSQITLVLFFVSQRQRVFLEKLPKNQVTSAEVYKMMPKVIAKKKLSSSYFLEFEVKVSHSVVSDSATPWTRACQASLSMEFSRKKILEWVAISFSRGSSWSRDWTHVSCIEGRFFTIWATF